MSQNSTHRRVVYLFGAGATHACLQANSSSRGLLMANLSPLLATRLRKLVTTTSAYAPLSRLVNDIIDDDADFEHLISFLSDSPSHLHKQLATDMRDIFHRVLQQELKSIEDELGPDRFILYAALLDMYNVRGCPETLHAILTLNYDDFIESAASLVYNQPVNPGIALRGTNPQAIGPTVIKLHGSFTWREEWPISTTNRDNLTPLWIPPAAQKAKDHYPFNTLWGLARDLLDCDVLRVVGCRLGSSDLDLISLLFATRHVNARRTRPYAIEIIDSPAHALKLQSDYPYLDVRSLVEISYMDIGTSIVADLTNGAPRRYDDLDPQECQTLLAERNENWFRIWLQQMAFAFSRDLGIPSVATRTGAFRRLLMET